VRREKRGERDDQDDMGWRPLTKGNLLDLGHVLDVGVGGRSKGHPPGSLGNHGLPPEAVALGVRQRRGKSLRHQNLPQDIVLWC